MDYVKLSPAIFCLLLLGAHFFRAGWLPLVIFYLSLVGLLFVKRDWVARLVQLSLVLGSLEWVRSLMVYVAERQAIGQPWKRLALILGTIALFTALSAIVFQCRSLKIRYKLR